MNVHAAGHARRWFGDLVIDPLGRQVFLGDREIRLTRLEFALLSALTDHPGTVATPRQLLETVWGYAWLGDDHVVETHIGRLRTKLGESGRKPRFIHTVRGVGYRFQAHPQQVACPVEPRVSAGEWVISVLLRVTVSATGDVLDVVADILDDETDGRELPEFA